MHEVTDRGVVVVTSTSSISSSSSSPVLVVVVALLSLTPKSPHVGMDPFQGCHLVMQPIIVVTPFHLGKAQHTCHHQREDLLGEGASGRTRLTKRATP